MRLQTSSEGRFHSWMPVGRPTQLIMLQEAITLSHRIIFRDLFPSFNVFFSKNNRNVTLIHSSLQSKVMDLSLGSSHSADYTSLWTEVVVNGTKLAFVNIYRPGDVDSIHWANFYDELYSVRLNYQNVILCGDVNCHHTLGGGNQVWLDGSWFGWCTSKPRYDHLLPRRAYPHWPPYSYSQQYWPLSFGYAKHQEILVFQGCWLESNPPPPEIWANTLDGIICPF